MYTPTPLPIDEASLDAMMLTNMFTLIAQSPIDHSDEWQQCRATWHVMSPLFVSTIPTADAFRQALLNYVSSTHFSNRDKLDQLEQSISTVISKSTSEPLSAQIAISLTDGPIRHHLSILQPIAQGYDNMFVGCCTLILRFARDTIPPPSDLGSAALPPNFLCPPFYFDIDQDQITRLLLASSITN